MQREINRDAAKDCQGEEVSSRFGDRISVSFPVHHLYINIEDQYHALNVQTHFLALRDVKQVFY